MHEIFFNPPYVTIYGCQKMSTRLEIRINPQDKEKLERLAQVFNINVSELLRSYIVKFTTIEKTLETLETTRMLEKKLVKALILSKPFQELLERLVKYVRTCEKYVGFHDEKLVVYNAIAIGRCINWTIAKENGVYKLYRVVWVIEKNEYGTEWLSEHNPSYEEPQSLREITEFLDDVEFDAETSLQQKIEEIKSIIK